MFRSLRFRLILLTGLILLPLVAAMLYSASQERTFLKTRVQDEALLVVQEFAATQDQFLSSAVQLLIVTSRVPEIRAYHGEACDERLADLVAYNQTFTYLGVATVSGDVVCSSSSLRNPNNLAGSDYVHQVIATRTFAVSDFQVQRTGGFPSINAGYPLFDDRGHVAGLLIGELNLTGFGQALTTDHLSIDSTITLVDRAGTILAGTSNLGGGVGASLAGSELIEGVLDAARGTVQEIAGPDGIERFYAVERLGPGDAPIAYLAVGIPTSAAYQVADRRLIRGLLLVSLITLISVLTAWFGGKRLLIAPLRALGQTAQQLESGDLSTRTGVESSLADLNQLATGFNRMASKLQQRDHDLKAAEAKYRSIVETAAESILVSDTEGRITFVNSRVIEMFGYSRDELVGQFVAMLFEGDSQSLAMELDEDHNHPLLIPTDLKCRRKDGSSLWSIASGSPLVDDAGGCLGTLTMITDVTKRKTAEIALRLSEARFRALVLFGNDIIIVVDATDVITYASPSVESVLGYDPEALVGANVMEFVHHEDRSGALVALNLLGASAQSSVPLEFRVRRKDGVWRTFEVIGINRIADPAVQGIVWNGRDISDRKGIEAAMTFQAFHDALTKLPNRTLFADRLDQALRRLARKGNSVVVLFIDVDDFKEVNDSLGHAAGDLLLIEIANRLRGCVRIGDTVARFGGDEFACILEEVTSLGEAEDVKARIRAFMQAPIDLDGHEIVMTLSIGIAINSIMGMPAADLMRHADQAMYVAKQGGKNRTTVFSSTMDDDARTRHELEMEIRRALIADEFCLHYQPIVAMVTGHIVEVEALALAAPMPRAA